MSSFLEYYFSENPELSLSDIPFLKSDAFDFETDFPCVPVSFYSAEVSLFRWTRETPERLFVATPFGFFDVPKKNGVCFSDFQGTKGTLFFLQNFPEGEWCFSNGKKSSTHFFKKTTDDDGFEKTLYTIRTEKKRNKPIDILVFQKELPENFVVESLAESLWITLRQKDGTVNRLNLEPCFNGALFNIHVFLPGDNGFFSEKEHLFSIS